MELCRFMEATLAPSVGHSTYKTSFSKVKAACIFLVFAFTIWPLWAHFLCPSIICFTSTLLAQISIPICLCNSCLSFPHLKASKTKVLFGKEKKKKRKRLEKCKDPALFYLFFMYHLCFCNFYRVGSLMVIAMSYSGHAVLLELV